MADKVEIAVMIDKSTYDQVLEYKDVLGRVVFKTEDSDGHELDGIGFDIVTENEAAPLEVTTASSVDHPSHYNQGKYEVIDVINDWNLNFALGNVIKYVARAPFKGKTKEDLEKAMWYLKYHLDHLS